MKKIIILLFTVLIVSCENDRNNAMSAGSLDDSNLNSKNIVGAQLSSISIREVDLNNKCGSSGGGYPVYIDPNGYYVNWETVYYYDGYCDGSASCIDLSHFVDKYLVYNQRVVPAFFGYGEIVNFSNVYSLNTSNLRIEQEVDTIPYYGDMFPSSTPMSNDAMNTVLQKMQTAINTIKNNGGEIKAVYLSTENYLCLPATRGFNLSIKYD